MSVPVPTTSLGEVNVALTARVRVRWIFDADCIDPVAASAPALTVMTVESEIDALLLKVAGELTAERLANPLAHS